MSDRRPRFWPALVLLAIATVLATALWVGRPDGGAEGFSGTDAAATERIAADHPDYQPWAEPVLVPAGGEVESGLFALQAALGAGALGFILGTLRERSRRRGADPAPPPDAA